MNTRRFFEHMEIHLVQFDTKIQAATIIRSQKELPSLTDSFSVHGFGGTDYRCVFEYANAIRRGVQGLLILTDGYGTYPSERPAYPTAFLLADFLKEDSGLSGAPGWDRVPGWAIRFSIMEGRDL